MFELDEKNEASKQVLMQRINGYMSRAEELRTLVAKQNAPAITSTRSKLSSATPLLPLPEFVLRFPQQAAGAIIGPRGSYMHQVQEEFGVRLTIKPHVPGETSHLLVSGGSIDCSKALWGPISRLRDDVGLSVQIPLELTWAEVITSSVLEEFNAWKGVMSSIHNIETIAESVLVLVLECDDGWLFRKALLLLQNAVLQLGIPKDISEFQLFSGTVGQLIGPGGRTLKGIKERTGVSVSIPHRRSESSVTCGLWGPPEGAVSTTEHST
jgi:hypothetical protein